MTNKRILVKLALTSDLVDFFMNNATHDRIELTLTFPAATEFVDMRTDIIDQLDGIAAVELFGMTQAVQEFARWHSIFQQLIESSTNLHDLRHRLHIDGAMPECNHGQSAIHYFATISTQVVEEPKDTSVVVYDHSDISADPRTLVDLTTTL